MRDFIYLDVQCAVASQSRRRARLSGAGRRACPVSRDERDEAMDEASSG